MKTFEKNLLKKLKKSSNIFIMGHKSLDLDALGAAAGISAIAKKYNKEAKIIINDKEHESAVKLALEYLKDKIIVTNSKKITNISQNDLLIVLDVNKKYLLQDETLLNIIHLLCYRRKRAERNQYESIKCKITVSHSSKNGGYPVICKKRR